MLCIDDASFLTVTGHAEFGTTVVHDEDALAFGTVNPVAGLTYDHIPVSGLFAAAFKKYLRKFLRCRMQRVPFGAGEGCLAAMTFFA